MNRMTRIATGLTLALAAASPQIQAGNGSGDGGGPLTDIYAGVCETLSGTVMEAGYNGTGYVIDTGLEQVTVFGVGPARYWEDLGVALPQVGEGLEVDVCWVVFSDGTSKAVATAVDLGDQAVVLRDPDTGRPLWRAAGNAVQAEAGGGGQVQARVGGGGNR